MYEKDLCLGLECEKVHLTDVGLFIFLIIFLRKLGNAANDCEKYPELAIAAYYALLSLEITSSKASNNYKKMKNRLGERFTLEKTCLKCMAASVSSALFDPNVTPYIDVSNPSIV